MAQVQQRTLQSLQVIAGALLAGVTAFGVVVLVIGPTVEPGAASSTLTQALLGVAGLLLVTHTVVLRLLDQRVGAKLAARRHEALAELERNDVPQELFVRTLVAAALGESIALIGPVLYLVAGSPFAAGPLVVGLGWMLLQFPTRSKLRSAIDGAGRPSY